jgi:hypothetical protein
VYVTSSMDCIRLAPNWSFGAEQRSRIAIPSGVGSKIVRSSVGRQSSYPMVRGMGAPISGGAATADQIAATGASTTVGILVALGTISGPVGAAIGGIIALSAAIASLFGGCGQTCVQASNIANQLGDTLTQNLNTYLAAPIHYQSLQAAALNNFDTAWAALVQACSNPALGSAGKACISDRQQGACKWKASPGGWKQVNGQWTYSGYGPAGSGTACWNYFVGMRDPIANDPTVVPDPSPVSAAVTSATSGVTSAITSVLPSSVSSLLTSTVFGIPVYIVGAAALLGLWFISEEA